MLKIGEGKINRLSTRLVAKVFAIVLLCTLFSSLSIAQNKDINLDSFLLEVDKKELTYDKARMIEMALYKYPKMDTIKAFFLLDTLEHFGKTSTLDTVQIYTAVAHHLRSSTYGLYDDKFEEALVFGEKSVKRLEEILADLDKDHPRYKIWKKMKAGIHLNTGLGYNKIYNSAKTLEHYEKALQLSQDIELLPYIQLCYTWIGTLYYSKGDYTTAADYYYSGINMPDSTLSMYTVETYGGLAKLKQKLGESEEALNYYMKAEALIDSLDDPKKGMYKLSNLAGLHHYYIGEDNIGKADSTLQMMKTLSAENNTHYLYFFGCLSQSGSYSKTNEFQKAREHLSLAKSYLVEGSKDMLANYYSQEAFILMNEKKYGQAKKIAKQSLELHETNGRMSAVETALENLSEIESHLGNYKQSLDYHKQFHSLHDSLLNDKVKINQDLLSVQYETSKKESKIKKLELMDLEQDAKIANQRLLIGGSLAVLSILGLMLFGLYRNGKQKSKLNQILQEKNTIIQNKSDQNEILLKEIHHRVKNNLQTISSLLYLQSTNVNDRDAKDAIAQSQHRVETMALIHKNLYQGDNLSGIEIKDYINRLILNLQQAYLSPGQKVTINLDMEEIVIDVDTAIPLGLIINEILTNSYKYAFPDNRDGNIDIEFSLGSEEQFRLRVSDNGIGNESGMSGFGSKLITLLTKQLGAVHRSGNQNGYWTEIKKEN